MNSLYCLIESSKTSLSYKYLTPVFFPTNSYKGKISRSSWKSETYLFSLMNNHIVGKCSIVNVLSLEKYSTMWYEKLSESLSDIDLLSYSNRDFISEHY